MGLLTVTAFEMGEHRRSRLTLRIAHVPSTHQVRSIRPSGLMSTIEVRDADRHPRNTPGDHVTHAPPLLWRAGLVAAVLLLAIAPWFVDAGYSIVTNTISESGGQGVHGAWIMRTGVVLTAISVWGIAISAGSPWTGTAKHWLRLYAVALLMLAAFPESPFYPGPHNESMAQLHTVAAVFAAVTFIIGVGAMSRSRPSVGFRIFDWMVIRRGGCGPPS